MTSDATLTRPRPHWTATVENREIDHETDHETDALDAFRLDDVLFCPDALDAFLRAESERLQLDEQEAA